MGLSATDLGPKPRLAPPPGACDCHSHVYGPGERYPFAEGAGPVRHTAADAAAYTRLLDHLGIERAVIVQPSAYGTDNRCTLEAMRLLGPRRARGVAVCRLGSPPAALAALDDAGIRGFRFSRHHSAVTLADLPQVARMIAPYGWHIQVQEEGADALDWFPLLADLPVPVVIDHIARMPKNLDLDDPRFIALLRLLEGGNVWLKISGPYYGSALGHPYADVAPRIARLAEVRPDRLVWALNWPHPSFPDDAKPEPAACLDILLDALPDAAVREALLADNPAALYGFPG